MTTSTRRGARLVAVLALATATLFGLTTAPASAAPGVANIGPGSTNIVGVSCVQDAYNVIANAGLNVDGDYGTLTRQATINFQRFFGLQVDGIVGKQTGDLLFYLMQQKRPNEWTISFGCYDWVPTS